MTTLLAPFAKVERDLISERTREGLARARASGRKLGRPKGSLGVSRLDGREEEIRRFLKLGVFQDRHREAHGRVADGSVQLHEHAWPRAAEMTLDGSTWGRHAPAPVPGRVTVRGLYTVSGPPPRSCADNGTP